MPARPQYRRPTRRWSRDRANSRRQGPARRRRGSDHRAGRSFKAECAGVVPSLPVVARGEFDAARAEPVRSQARSNGEVFMAAGNHASAVADECRLAQALAPARTASGGNASMAGAELGRAVAVAREERREILAVGQVEPAAARHQELAAHRRHAVVDGDARAGRARRHRPPSARRGRRRSTATF